jgi:hypothetical protein
MRIRLNSVFKNIKILFSGKEALKSKSGKPLSAKYCKEKIRLLNNKLKSLDTADTK